MIQRRLLFSDSTIRKVCMKYGGRWQLSKINNYNTVAIAASDRPLDTSTLITQTVRPSFRNTERLISLDKINTLYALFDAASVIKADGGRFDIKEGTF